MKDIIQLVGLKGFEDFYPHQISAGMKQRVAIARAFVTEPDLLLMDEPFGQLDTNTRFQIETRLIEVWEKTKRTVIFVTHNLEEAVYLAGAHFGTDQQAHHDQGSCARRSTSAEELCGSQICLHPQAGYGTRQVVVDALSQRKGTGRR